MCPIVVVQMGLISICNSGPWTHVGKPIWVACGDPFGSLWATHKGYMVPVFGAGGEQERRRSACTSALSDQLLCCSLFVKCHS